MVTKGYRKGVYEWVGWCGVSRPQLRVFVSTAASPVQPITDRRMGSIGIDINPDQRLAELDRFGNFTGGEPIPCVTYGKTQAQAKAILNWLSITGSKAMDNPSWSV